MLRRCHFADGTTRERERERERDVDLFRARLLSLESESNLLCTKKQVSGRKRKAEDDDLPFGLRLGKCVEPKCPKTRTPDPDLEVSDMSHAPSEHVSEASLDDENPNSEEPGDCSEPDAGPERPDADSASEQDAEPWNAMGIKCFEVAGPAARAKCCVCNSPVRGLRLDYRFAVSDKLAD